LTLDNEKIIRLMIVDDHHVVQKGLELILSDVEWLDLVGFAGTGPDAVDLAKSLRPDLVIMDLRLPGFSGIEAMIKIRDFAPDVKFVVLSYVGEKDDLFEAIDAGANAYLLKDSSKSELIAAITAVTNGGSVLSPGLLNHLANRGNRSTKSSLTGDVLTAREMDVLNCMSNGFANKQIAKELKVSLSTVKAHVANILVKFEVSDRTEAVVSAIRAKVIKV
jgi:DNA-binding NarL/FixJ family response regulator